MTNTLPHWDMSNIYPSLESEEFKQGNLKTMSKPSLNQAAPDHIHQSEHDQTRRNNNQNNVHGKPFILLSIGPQKPRPGFTN